MTDILINARQITPQHIVDLPSSAVDIDIVANTHYGFLGPDSSSISAWLQTIAAITPPARGKLQFLGQDTTRLDRNSWQAMRNNIAYTNKDNALLSVLSTQENILLPALYHKLDTRESLTAQMTTLLHQIGFTDMSNLARLPAYLDELSYFQAMLVRIILTNPRIVIIDNSMRHIDERTSRKLVEFLKLHLAKSRATLLLHDDDADFVIRNTSKFIFVGNHFLLQFNSRNELQDSDNEHVLQYLHEIATI